MQTKIGIVGALPSKPTGPALQWIHPHTSEQFSGCTELNIGPPEPKLSWMLLVRLGGEGGYWVADVFWFPEGYAEALWFLVYGSYSWFQNYPKYPLPILGL